MPEYLEADFPVCSPGHLHSSHYQEIFEDFNKNLWSFSNLVSNHCFPELLSQWEFCYTNMVAFWIHPIFLHIFPHGACSCNPFCLFVCFLSFGKKIHEFFFLPNISNFLPNISNIQAAEHQL